MAVVVRVGSGVGRVRGVGLLDHVKLAGLAVQHLQALQAVRPPAKHDVVDVDVDEVQPLRSDDPFRHPHMRLVRVRILVRERIRQVRIKQQVPALPLKKKTTLPEPPQMQRVALSDTYSQR